MEFSDSKSNDKWVGLVMALAMVAFISIPHLSDILKIIV
jgi:hypothetical protein